MNIKLIKTEIEKLSLMLSSWEGEESISAIERDIALDKLKKIYDMVRFDATACEAAPAAMPTAAPAQDDAAEDQQEQDVEVELIFADEEDFLSTLPEAVEEIQDQHTDEPSLVEEILASAMVASPVGDAAEAVVADEPEPAEENDTATTEPEVEPVADITPEQQAVTEPTAEVAVETEPQAEQTESIAPEMDTPAAEQSEPDGGEKEKTEEKPEEKQPQREEPRSLNSLFGLEEVQRRPRTKHQRMMSIYSNSEPAPEKVVDISKIFDVAIDTPKPMTSKSTAPAPKPAPAPAPKPAPAHTDEDRHMTIADIMAASTQTLADTIVAPSALGEEINHSKIASLRDGIGLNDKFLMIRDLFDGDDEAYDEAITALDSMETLDDCMIHIIENYAWSPDTEGSKFIMQLLERKLS